MSLLNDALKRAKLEALEREAAGQTDYGMPTLPAGASRRGPGLPAILAAIVLLAVLGVVIGWLLGRVTASPDAQPDPADAARAVEVGPTAAQIDSQVTAAPGDEQSASAVDPAAPTNATGGTSTRQEDVPVTEVADPVESATSASPPGIAVETVPAEQSASGRPVVEVSPPAATEDSSPRDGTTYVRVLEQRGQRLELQGIAYRGGTSVAIINDLMVSRDDMVGGFRVVAIEPDRVQLQGGGVTFYLALH